MVDIKNFKEQVKFSVYFVKMIDFKNVFPNKLYWRIDIG